MYGTAHRRHPRRGRAAAATLLAALLLAALPAPSAQAATTPANPGFESGTTGWSTYSPTGQPAASFTEPGGHTGATRLSHWSASAYRVETYQYLTGLTDGTYTLSARVRSSGGQNAAYIALRNCGTAEQRTDLPATANGAWIRVVTSVRVTGGGCTISLNSDAGAGQWANFDDITFTPGTTGLAVKGGDLSTLPKNEAYGARYRDASGATGDAMSILGAAGMNYVRLKVWVNPADGYNDKAHVLAMAKRAKALGMKTLIDFHYSDRWADPGHQTKPAAWAGHGYEQLKRDVHDHTYDVLNALKAQGITADMVQIGNETNAGMLWPEGSTANWPQLAGLLTAGANAAKAVSSGTRVALHLAEGGDNGGTRWWFDNAVAQRVPFDVVALSYYGYWHGPLSALQTNLDDTAARYGKPVLVAETAYAHTLANGDGLENNIATASQLAPGYPATPAGQAANLRDVMNVVEAVPNGRGLGVVHWEPSWTAVRGSGWDPQDPASGNAWENQALFGYDTTLLPAARWFSHR
ncbi:MULTISPECIES: glycosyl hydrolase 53 family protein [unclassified Streptomyces]|uniref:glycosyl hydrolase 53 family protein n=1 Tax=unclassified Streptomyces TaxID=2593676 RepID=UPI00081F1278|nr:MULTISPECIES: glycosyl hydrolase 53 family protein [unclassified Streptomyces]MYR93955.1 arabinogalactan endo-1,4-beta-galactosidase [Streptomyces sp. SID4937]SCD62438.1 arabinogalactan endo-1,4-beta-galactosidase [Streptomyces sp. ScaeMP-e83]